MKVKVIEKEILETEVHIYHSSHLDNETKDLLNYLKYDALSVIAYQNERAYRISIKDIYYIEYLEEKTFLYLDKDVYLSNYKLYEWEEKLKESTFVRISKNTILNIHYLKSVRPMLGGKMEATLKNNEHLIINRHYLTSFKKKFGL